MCTSRSSGNQILNFKFFDLLSCFARTLFTEISSFEERANAMSIHRVRNSDKFGIFFHPSSKHQNSAERAKFELISRMRRQNTSLLHQTHSSVILPSVGKKFHRKAKYNSPVFVLMNDGNIYYDISTRFCFVQSDDSFSMNSFRLSAFLWLGPVRNSVCLPSESRDSKVDRRKKERQIIEIAREEKEKWVLNRS